MKKGITPCIPLPCDAKVHGKSKTTYHDKIVQYIKDKGNVYAFSFADLWFTRSLAMAKENLIEERFSKIKRCIGEKLNTHKLTSQKKQSCCDG